MKSGDRATSRSSARKMRWIAGLLATSLVSCNESSEGDPRRVVSQEIEQPAAAERVEGGTLTAAADTSALPQPPASSKVIAFAMSIDRNGAIVLKDPRVSYGEPPNQIGNPPMFTARLLDTRGDVVSEVPLWDPRWIFVWSDAKNRDSLEISEAAETVVVVPFSPELVSIELLKGEERVTALDLSRAIGSFCASHRADPDCQGEKRDHKR